MTQDLLLLKEEINNNKLDDIYQKSSIDIDKFFKSNIVNNINNIKNSYSYKNIN